MLDVSLGRLARLPCVRLVEAGSCLLLGGDREEVAGEDAHEVEAADGEHDKEADQLEPVVEAADVAQEVEAAVDGALVVDNL